MTRRGGRLPHQLAGGAPWFEFELVLVDGDNLLHRVRGMRDEAGLRWLLPRMRAWLPAGARAIVMLDGHPDPGDSYRRRVATGVEFQHSGKVDADTALVGTLGARPYADRARTVVVSDDRALGDRVRRVGGLVRRLDWLVGGLAAAVGDAGVAAEGIGASRGGGAGSGRGASQPVGIGAGMRPASGAGRGPAHRSPNRSPIGTARSPTRTAHCDSSAGDPERREDAGREPWKPGRGATRKRGNPRRGH